MDIKVITKDAAYITIGDWTIYVDNSTGEHVISSWEKGSKKEISVSSKQNTFDGFKLEVTNDVLFKELNK